MPEDTPDAVPESVVEVSEKERQRLEAKAIADANREKRRSKRQQKLTFTEEVAHMLQVTAGLSKEDAEKYAVQIVEMITQEAGKDVTPSMDHVSALSENGLIRAGISIVNHRKKILNAISGGDQDAKHIDVLMQVGQRVKGSEVYVYMYVCV